MLWLINKFTKSPIARAVAFVATLLFSVFAYGKAQRVAGKAEVKEELIQDDLQNAIRIREKMDDAKREADAIANDAKLDAVLNELRRRGKLRD